MKSQLSSSQLSLYQSFRDGSFTPNEFAVMLAVQSLAKGKSKIKASAPTVGEALYGNLSRQSVGRALRNLEKKGRISWKITNGHSSTIEVLN